MITTTNPRTLAFAGAATLAFAACMAAGAAQPAFADWQITSDEGAATITQSHTNADGVTDMVRTSTDGQTWTYYSADGTTLLSAGRTFIDADDADYAFLTPTGTPVASEFVSNGYLNGNKSLTKNIAKILNAKYKNGGLKALYKYVVGLKYTGGSSYPKGNWKTWSAKFANEMATKKKGNCYRFASLFGWLAIGAGQDAKVVAGQSKQGSGWQAHSWVEIGKKVYDPECQMVLDKKMKKYSCYGKAIKKSGKYYTVNVSGTKKGTLKLRYRNKA